MVLDETSTKLRCSYLLYYYLLKVLPDINTQYNCAYYMNNKFYCDVFRNAMAHYKLGVLLKENEIKENDIMFGLTQKCFGMDYISVKNSIISELKGLSVQLKETLNL